MVYYAVIDPNTRTVLDFPVTNLKKKFPNMSFPVKITSTSLPTNIVIVKIDPKPEVNLLQKVVQNTPTYSSTTKSWTSTWTILDKTEAEIQASFADVYDIVRQQTQILLDEFAQTRGYDNIVSACSYATSTNLAFAAEAQRCVELRDITWATLNQYYADVNAGIEPLPSTIDEILSNLPALTWV